MGRPTGITGSPHLKQADLFRILVLNRDARMGPTEISKVTGYTIHQIKYALKKKTPTIGLRTGRPRKDAAQKKQGGGAQALPEGAGEGTSDVQFGQYVSQGLGGEAMEVEQVQDQQHQQHQQQQTESVQQHHPPEGQQPPLGQQYQPVPQQSPLPQQPPRVEPTQHPPQVAPLQQVPQVAQVQQPQPVQAQHPNLPQQPSSHPDTPETTDGASQAEHSEMGESELAERLSEAVAEQ